MYSVKLYYSLLVTRYSLLSSRPLRLVVRTPGSHPGNTGSTPVGVTQQEQERIIKHLNICYLKPEN